MPHQTPTIDQIEANILRDVKNIRPEADVQPGSDLQARAAGFASATEGLYEHQQWIVRQIFPDTADEENLLRHCDVSGIKRKAATAAGGTVAATGPAGRIFPAGLTLAHADGRMYITTAAVTLDAMGQAQVPVSAVLPGLAGNLAVGQPLTFQSPPLGLPGDVVVASAITGGTDIESLDALLARLLELIRRPPAGGNKYDFKRWALEVPGVTAAYVYPLRRGLGTVDTVIVANDGIPSPAVIAAAQAHVDDVRPVTAKNALVLAATLKLQDITVQLLAGPGQTIAGLTSKVQACVASYFATLQPGDPLIVSKLLGQITNLPGVADAKISAPTGNVVAVVDSSKVEWLRVGVVSVVPLP